MASFHLHDIQRKTGKFVRKFGTHDDVDANTTNESIWSYADVAGDYTFPNDAGETMYISSNNDNDTMPIKVQGLDENFKEKEEVVIMQGQTRITLGGKWSRINRVYNDNTDDVAGNIFVYTGGDNTLGEPDVDSDVKGIIENGHNQTMQAVYTVPIDKEFNLSSYHLSCDAKVANTTANLTAKLCVRLKSSVFRTQEIIAVSNVCPSVIKYDMPLPIPGGSDVLFVVESSTTNNMAVHCVFEGMLL